MLDSINFIISHWDALSGTFQFLISVVTILYGLIMYLKNKGLKGSLSEIIKTGTEIQNKYIENETVINEMVRAIGTDKQENISLKKSISKKLVNVGLNHILHKKVQALKGNDINPN
jgi:hypothetical protein